MNNHKQLQEIPEFYLNQDPQRFNLQVKQRKSLNIVNRWRNQYKNNLKNFQCISKFIKILNPVLMLIVTILLFAYVGLIYYNGQSNQEVYEQFLQNQNQEIIAGIYIEWLSSTCQAPYEPIFNYNFDQQIIGCDCSQTNQQNISVGKECNSFLLKQGCFTFHQRLQQNLTQLNNNGYGTSFIICVKREKNVSLKNNQTYCQQEQRTVCGKDLKYCLPINVNCPITEFGIRSFADIDEQYIDKSINLGNRQFFYFGYNENILPISEVLLIKGDKVCKLNKNIYQQVIQYENKEKFCSYFDPLYKNVYTISEEQFFQSNNLIQYKNELNYFYVNNTQNWTLQTKSYTLISDECQDQDFFNKMLTNEYEAQINSIQFIAFFKPFFYFFQIY
ncbi:unnamed protein product [Paramecium sonneborni]|uniref:Transmembrane protein n=1 Tax=Paramecium sonneborni TaxID=65129 RepID=A0A8S1LJ75_9CILI|nr:unnamed protein product [Paramecium sonneborni]